MIINNIWIGFQHVIPLGYDHILFIVSLFFLNSKLKSALLQCTIFTIAHSFTLAIVTIYNPLINFKLIEIFISISIIFVSIENSLKINLKIKRVYFIFIFGLIHGMGFASALKNIGFEKSELISSLLGFNIGVELAQFLIILICFLITFKLINKGWYNSKIVQPISLIISLVAIYWTIDQII